MGELKTLLLLELRSLYGINRFRYTRDKKEKNRFKVLSVAWVLLILMAIGYVSALVIGLCYLGCSSIVPAYLVVLSTGLILAVGIFTTATRLFNRTGYDILSAMPVRTVSVALSRFIAMYLSDFLIAFVLTVPGIIAYGIIVKPPFSFYPIMLTGMLLIPAIPLVLSTLIGTVILSVSSRMKHQSLVQSLLMVLLVVGVLAGSFRLGNTAENITPEQLTQFAQTAFQLFEQIYPPAMWLSNAVMKTDVLALFLFVVCSLIAAAVAVFAVTASFHGIVRRLQTTYAKHDYTIGNMNSRSLLKALWSREAKRYFSSSIYVTNTIVGPVLGTILSVALCITGTDVIREALPIPVDVTQLIPFVFSAVFTMMTPASVSISMEGRQFWIVKSLPIPIKALLDSKLLWSLSLMLPFYVVSVIAMSVALSADILQLMWILLIPVSVSILAVVSGITINLTFCSFDWEREEVVVKQSISSLLGGFSGFIISVLTGVLVCLTPAPYTDITKGLLCILLLTASVFLYRKNNRTNLVNL